VDVSLSCVVPWYNVLNYELKTKVTQAKYAAFHVPIGFAISKVENYYALTSHAYTAATVLDPRMKLVYFEAYQGLPGHESVGQVERFVRTDLAPYLKKPLPESAGSNADTEKSQALVAQVNAMDALLGRLGPVCEGHR